MNNHSLFMEQSAHHPLINVNLSRANWLIAQQEEVKSVRVVGEEASPEPHCGNTSQVQNHVKTKYDYKEEFFCYQLPPIVARISLYPSFSKADATVSWSFFPGVKATI